jgi:eukaryotic-like serine/threonine-protein kinase
VADEVIAGRYRLEERLGAGGMSEVWSALDLELDRRVAVKLLAPHADRARFEHEARAVAALAHPNICALYGYGETEGRPFMVLEYLPGGSLEDLLALGRPLPDDETRTIAHDLAAGLAHAHERGLVHRDLKPSNVLFDSEARAKIADFGIARLGEPSGLTEVGTVLGTATTISPEQAAGSPATPASDVYAFGVILYRMLAGRPPFEAKDAMAMVAMHRDEPPPPLATIRPDAPARLESLATAALAKSPADRPRDGTALLAELGGAVPAALGDTAATQVVQKREPGPRRSRTTFVVAAAVLLATIGVALAVAVTFRGGTTSTPPSTSLPTTMRPTTTAPVVPTAEPTTEPTTELSVPATTEPVTTAAPPTTAIETTVATPTTAPVTTAPLPPIPPPPIPPPPATTTVPPPTTDTTPTDTTPTDTGPTVTTAPVPPG